MEKDKREKVNVLFVCTGNTCRSPMAEQLFSDYLKKNKCGYIAEVSSAGIYADNGTSMTPEAAGALSELNVTVKPHKSRRLSIDILQNADIVVCMTEEHRDAILSSDTYNFATSDGKKRIIGTVKELIGSDVSDPYGKGIDYYRLTLEQLGKMNEPLLSAVKQFREENKPKLPDSEKEVKSEKSEKPETVDAIGKSDSSNKIESAESEEIDDSVEENIDSIEDDEKTE